MKDKGKISIIHVGVFLFLCYHIYLTFSGNFDCIFMVKFHFIRGGIVVFLNIGVFYERKMLAPAHLSKPTESRIRGMDEHLYL